MRGCRFYNPAPTMTKTQGARMAKGVVRAAGASALSLMLWGCNVQEPPV